MKTQLLAAFAASLVIGATAGAQGSKKFLLCSARDRDNTAGYVNAVMAVTAETSPAVQIAWNKMAMAKYNALGSSTACATFGDSAAAESQRTKMLDRLKDDGLKITNVTWSYSASTPANAQASAAPAPDQAAKDEMPSAQGYCESTMREMRTLLGCDCFAKSVYKHRLAHPEEVNQSKGDKPQMLPIGQLVAGADTKLDCSECLTDEHIDAYVKEKLTVRNPSSKMAGKLSVSDKVAACVKKKFTERMRAEPYVHLILQTWNQTYTSCVTSND